MQLLSESERKEIYEKQMKTWTLAKGWNDYLKLFPKRDESFLEKKYLRGSFSELLAEMLKEAILAAPVIPINNDSKVNGAGFNTINPNDTEILNKSHQYRDFTVETQKALAEVFEVLKEPIAKALNSPWRVITCRSWSTKPEAVRHGPNVWHCDGGYPEDMLKLMIYSTPTGWGQGGLQVEVSKDKVLNVQGAAGQWILFYNSILKHCAIAPVAELDDRVATEVTICPSFGYDLRPKFLGLIGNHPEFPYT